jgi:hypothetical protein
LGRLRFSSERDSENQRQQKDGRSKEIVGHDSPRTLIQIILFAGRTGPEELLDLPCLRHFWIFLFHIPRAYARG